MLVKSLGEKDNDKVERAADALAAVGDRTVAAHLIQALVTRHYTYVEVPVSHSGYGSYAVGSGQIGFANQQVLQAELIGRAGGVPPIYRPQLSGRRQRVAYDKRNVRVHAALTALTGQDFGYDKGRWWAWLRTQT